MSHNRKSSSWFFTGLRRLRTILVTTAAIVIILAAVIVGVGRMLIPYADQVRPWLEEDLSERLGHPVSFESVEVHWPQLTPRITLTSIRVGEPEEPLVSVDQARLELHLPHMFQPDQNLFNLVVLGLDLALVEGDDGQWGIRLEGGGQIAAGNGREGPLAGDLIIRDANVRVIPAALPATTWRLSEAEVQRGGDQTVVHGRLHPVQVGSSTMELRLKADHPQGRVQTVTAWAGITDLGLTENLIAGLLPDEVDLGNRRLNAAVWLNWSAEAATSIDVQFDMRGDRRAQVHGVLRAEYFGGRIDGELVELTRGGESVVSGMAFARRGNLWALAADTVNLAGLHALAVAWRTVLPLWPEQLSGRVEGLNILFESGQGLHAFGGRLTGLDISPTGAAPGVTGLDMDMSLAGDRVALRPSGAPRIDWPLMLRQPLELDRVRGQVFLSAQGIELDDVAIGHSVIDARADGWIYLSEGRPFLDFGIGVDRIETDDPRDWLPHGLIPEPALDWLDQALVRVGTASGGLVFHMRAGHKAADLQPGDFHAWVDFEAVRLDYWPEWPVATGLAGRVDFLGRGLFGRIDQGRVDNMPLAVDQAVIPDLTEPQLSFLMIADQVEANALAGILARIPVAGWADLIEPMQWTGPASAVTEIILPFGRMADWDIDGEVTLDGVDFLLPDHGVGLGNLQGTAHFDRRGVLPTVLNAGSQRRPVALDVAASFERPARVALGARIHPADVVARDKLKSMVSRRFAGSSYWHLELQAAELDGMRLSLYSDLDGLGMELPSPLAKLPPEIWPFSLEARVAKHQLEIEARLADRIDLRYRGEGDEWRLGLGLSGAVAQLPEAAGFDLHGHLEAFDLRTWSELYGTWVNGAPEAVVSGRANLYFDRFHYGDLYVEDVSLAMTRDETVWEFVISGESADGSIKVPVPMDSGRVLAVDFTRLHLNDAGVDRIEHGLDIQPSQTSTVSPAGQPPLHLLIEDFSYESLALGRVRVEAHAIRNGMEFEQVNIDGTALRLHGMGRWIDTAYGPHSEFDGRLITENLSELLGTLGYESGIEASLTQVDLLGRWPGAPQDFTLQRVAGDLRLQISDGLIPEARPGAGRLLGLASVSAIPRRLMLDFRDVFAQGLKFDQIEGDFKLGDGLAVTDNLRIDSPAARILVTGSTDMVARQYDQRLVVEPGVGATLPIIGVLAGGPAGAAAGLVLRTLLDRPLRGITEAHYSVTGSWDSPEVALIEARAADEDDEVIPPPD